MREPTKLYYLALTRARYSVLRVTMPDDVPSTCWRSFRMALHGATTDPVFWARVGRHPGRPAFASSTPIPRRPASRRHAEAEGLSRALVGFWDGGWRWIAEQRGPQWTLTLRVTTGRCTAAKPARRELGQRRLRLAHNRSTEPEERANQEAGGRGQKMAQLIVSLCYAAPDRTPVPSRIQRPDPAQVARIV
jgi:hypothetical protein